MPRHYMKIYDTFDATLDVSGLPCDTSPFTPVDGAPLDDIAPAIRCPGLLAAARPSETIQFYITRNSTLLGSLSIRRDVVGRPARPRDAIKARATLDSPSRPPNWSEL